MRHRNNFTYLLLQLSWCQMHTAMQVLIIHIIIQNYPLLFNLLTHYYHVMSASLFMSSPFPSKATTTSEESKLH